MMLWDIVTIVQHGFDWALCMAFGRKWHQCNAIPQGINYGVGITNLDMRGVEHEEYEGHPECAELFDRARWLDDGLT